ncbi:MAG TPA: nuclear transport factor 2 family protein [Porticoccaceae bacterium]
MAFTGPLEDRIRIQELYRSYADAAFRCDREAYLACWHKDGVRISPQETLRGIDALRDGWDQIWTNIKRMAFFSDVGATEVDGDTATAHCYCREIIKLKDGRIWKLVGRYDDRLVRSGGEWRFIERSYTLLLNEDPF